MAPEINHYNVPAQAAAHSHLGAREMKTYVDANRTLTSPFDIVVSGKTAGLESTHLQDKLLPWLKAGATWWIEGLWNKPEEQVIERIHQGPSHLE